MVVVHICVEYSTIVAYHSLVITATIMVHDLYFFDFRGDVGSRTWSQMIIETTWCWEQHICENKHWL